MVGAQVLHVVIVHGHNCSIMHVSSLHRLALGMDCDAGDTLIHDAPLHASNQSDFKALGHRCVHHCQCVLLSVFSQSAGIYAQTGSDCKQVGHGKPHTGRLSIKHANVLRITRGYNSTDGCFGSTPVYGLLPQKWLVSTEAPRIRLYDVADLPETQGVK